ncbi:Rossmann-like and DUF2520 domain-containing protein [Aequorivita marina]|uniref:Rossmann-like and DUF2520 domain-containing protein n=1 Tax=Aequorivita marina TaxID=3073654 RepID=UPI002873F77C|nr:DUF2520 domain-containing protein [Aequorivita sp. S2608]MDS1298815.1 DUF2520 domain-containing protein [Aequorivita sp. S2608]
MISVVLLGFGNVNSHLFKAFSGSNNMKIKQVYNRSAINISSPDATIPFTTEISEVVKADVYIIGIPDDAISNFSERLAFNDRLVVHTSGGVSIDALSNKNRRGVFYPLQSFSKQREVDFTAIPICLEAENKADLNLLQKLATQISKHVTEISSEERAKLHLAAVFVNNFTNYLYRMGSEILKEDDLSFNLLKPLIAETALKIETLSPKEAQTGPAKRKDIKTIEKHLGLLNNPKHVKFYTMFTEALKEE